MNEITHTKNLRVLAFPENGTWSAQCVEHDIAAQGSTMHEAVGQLALALAVELEMRGGDLSEIAPPPSAIVDKFQDGAGVYKSSFRKWVQSVLDGPNAVVGHRIDELRVA